MNSDIRFYAIVTSLIIAIFGLLIVALNPFDYEEFNIKDNVIVGHEITVDSSDSFKIYGNKVFDHESRIIGRDEPRLPRRSSLYMYNFKDERFDVITSVNEIKDWSVYIPQYPHYLEWYHNAVKEGVTPIDAATNILRIHLRLQILEEENHEQIPPIFQEQSNKGEKQQTISQEYPHLLHQAKLPHYWRGGKSYIFYGTTERRDTLPLQMRSMQPLSLDKEGTYQ